MGLSQGGLIAIIVVAVVIFIVVHIPICWQFYRLAMRFRNWIRKRNQIPVSLEDFMFSTVPDNIEEGKGLKKSDEDRDGVQPGPSQSLTHVTSVAYSIPELKGIQIKKRIGEGSFGEVFMGLWNETKVALKKLKGLDEYEEFKAETGVLFSVIHPNCVQFLGVFSSEDEKEFYIVLEYLSRGNCLDLLHKSSAELTILDLINMSISAAKGMSYLESQGIIHSDLACRNLLVSVVDGKYQLKVSDFGLSSSSVNTNLIDDSLTTRPRRRLPIRWTAPELLRPDAPNPTVKSDVWSFGVILWEMFSLGRLPYKGLRNHEVEVRVPSGLRLEKPTSSCPDLLFNLMNDCWKEEPADRPSFSRITKELKSIYKAMKKTEAFKDDDGLKAYLKRVTVDDETNKEDIYSTEELYQEYNKDRLYQSMSGNTLFEIQRNPSEQSNGYASASALNSFQQPISASSSVSGTGSSVRLVKIKSSGGTRSRDSGVTEPQSLYNNLEGDKSYKVGDTDSSPSSAKMSRNASEDKPKPKKIVETATEDNTYDALSVADTKHYQVEIKVENP